jgi:mannose-1-phosphate guanylyltransferase
MPNVHAVVMAGGSGTRFWPASRQRMPKQLLPLAGRPGETLIAATVRRLAPLIPPERVWVATGARLADATAAELPGVPRAQILAEPVPRNTAPCIAWATATIARAHPDAVVAVLPADHFIADEPGFREVLARALKTAEAGWLTTIGIVPTRPETGYGYIEIGDPIADGAHAVARFVEKPTRDRAEAFVAGGKHLWNAGMFFFRTGPMMTAIQQHLPALAARVAEICDEASLARVFPGLQAISIDKGVMEKADRIAVVPGSFGWNDVGSWEVTWELAAHDAQGNAVPEGTITVDATGNLVRDLSSGGARRRFALVGVRDLVIVETDDAVLVIPRERAQDVRAVVDELRARGETDKL